MGQTELMYNGGSGFQKRTSTVRSKYGVAKKENSEGTNFTSGHKHVLLT